MLPDGRAHVTAHITKFVMPGLKREARLRADVPGSNAFDSKAARKSWIARTSARRRASRFSPGMTKRMDATLARKYPPDDLFQDLPADGLVGERGIAPPPAVLLHFLGRGDKALRHLGKIRVGVVQAEDQATGPDPAQGELLRTQIILKHPIVARRLGVMDHPDRRKVADPYRQIVLGQHLVQPPRPLVPDGIEPAVDRTKRRVAKPGQEFIHRRHDIGVRIEGAAREADIDGMIFTKTTHQVLAPADHADRESAREALAIGHHVGAHAEIFLSAAGGEPEADEDLVKDQDDVALGADLPQRLEPGAVGPAFEIPAE